MLSIILLSYYSNERIRVVHRKVSEILNSNNIPFEFIIIDDGSIDNSYLIALELEKNNSNVRAFQLSKNHTSHYSIFAGLSQCKGVCAMPIPDDEQLPYQVIVDSYRLWLNGKKIIVPHRTNRDDGFVKALTANFFYKLMNIISDINYPPGGADSFLIDREIIDILNKINPVNTSIIAELLNLGYDPYFYSYARAKSNAKKSRWTLKKKRKLANDFIFSTSYFPIKLIKYTGLVFLFFGTAAIIIYLFSSDNSFKNALEFIYPSWTATAVLLSFFSGLLLYGLGITAEYIWRILCEVRNRPGYILRKKGKSD